MMATLHPSAVAVESIDQRVYLHDIDGQGYEALLALRGEQCGARVTYLQGELELMRVVLSIGGERGNSGYNRASSPPELI